MGETSYTEFFGTINNLTLAKPQIKLAKKLAATGTPIILVLAEGRGRLIRSIESKMSAVIGAFLPGPKGGLAIADVLFGDYNPSGRLPFTYHKHPHSFVPYDHKYAEELYLEKVGDVKKVYDPQYEFGHGLSYTSFKYSNLQLSAKEIKITETLDIKVDVKNKGSHTGQEIVQLYVSDVYASITPSVRKLKAFQKITLEKNSQQTIEFKIKSKDLAFVDSHQKWTTEPGEFLIKIGPLTTSFLLIP